MSGSLRAVQLAIADVDRAWREAFEELRARVEIIERDVRAVVDLARWGIEDREAPRAVRSPSESWPVDQRREAFSRITTLETINSKREQWSIAVERRLAELEQR